MCLAPEGMSNVISYHPFVDLHLERFDPSQVGLAVQSTAPNVNVGAFHIGSVGIAAPIGEENDMFPKMWVSL